VGEKRNNDDGVPTLLINTGINLSYYGIQVFCSSKQVLSVNFQKCVIQ